MTLSLLFLLIAPLFLLSSIFLPSHRLKVYVRSSLLGGMAVLLISFVDIFFPDVQIVVLLGQPFLPLFFFLLSSEQTFLEQCRIASAFFLLLLYFLLYLLSYALQKLLFLGQNMTIHWSGKILRHVGYSILFLLFTFVPLVLFFLNIRILLPFPDGIFSSLFQFFYPLEA